MLDQSVVNLARAIKQQETGNRPLQGGSGETGRYQFMPQTWKAWSGKYLGDPNAEQSLANENKVAYYRIKDWRDQGYSPGQIASLWNSGSPDWQGKVGVNSKGVKYDTPSYVKGVWNNYQRFKAENPATNGGYQGSSVAPQAAPVAPTAPAAPPSANEFLGNVIASGGKFIGDVAGAVAHPIRTTEAIGSVLRGTIASLFPQAETRLTQKSAANPFAVTPEQLQQDKQAASGVKDFYVQRYGSLEKAKQTAYKDPVGFLADIATVVEGGGAAVRAAGEASNISAIARAGEVAQKVGEAAQPLNIAGKALGGAGRVVQKTLGVSTGAGSGAIAEALRNPSPEFTDAMRGNIKPEEIVSQARDAFDVIKQNRSAEYRNQLAEISKNKDTFDISPVKTKAQQLLPNFGVKVSGGKLDFSRSTIADISEQRRIAQVYEEVKNWGTRKGDRTAVGLDTLKRRLGDFYSPSSQARAYVTALKSSVTDLLKKQVPGYEKMTAAYSAASDFIDELQSLSLNDRAKVDTTFKKLTSAMRENGDVRGKLVSDLQNATGKQLTSKIAGYQLSPIIPRGLIAKLPFITGGSFFHVSVLPALVFASPRVVGEFLRAYGLTSNQISAFLKQLPQLKKAALIYYQAEKATQAGRVQ